MKHTVEQLIKRLQEFPPGMLVTTYQAQVGAPVVEHVFLEETRAGTVLLDGYETHLDRKQAERGEKPAEPPIKAQTDPENGHNGQQEAIVAALISLAGGRIELSKAMLANPVGTVCQGEDPDGEHIILYLQ